MSGSSESRFLSALQAVRDALDELTTPSMFIGGVAVIAHGVARHTVDIDATVLASQASPERLAEVGQRHQLVPRSANAVEFARESQVLLMVHVPSSIPIDVTLAWLPFEAEALAARQEVDFGGVMIDVPRPEDLLLYKLVAHRPRDIEDAETLLLLHGKRCDLARVSNLLHQFCEALDDTERVATFLQLLKRAKLPYP
jgi:hypothetical protein